MPTMRLFAIVNVDAPHPVALSDLAAMIEGAGWCATDTVAVTAYDHPGALLLDDIEDEERPTCLTPEEMRALGRELIAAADR